MNKMADEDDRFGEPLPAHATTIFVVVGMLLIVGGSIGNILIIATIVANKALRVLHNVFVVNLAVADFLVTAYFLPLQVIGFVDGVYPVVGHRACEFVGFSIVWLFVTSLLSIAAISINRYIKVCRQSAYHRIFNRTTTLGACGAIWALAFLCTFPPIAGWGRFHFDEKNHYCGFDRSADLGYTLFLLCVSIALPAVLIVIFNFAIYRHVLQSRRRVMSFAGSDTHTSPHTGHGPRGFTADHTVSTTPRRVSDTSDEGNSHPTISRSQDVSSTLAESSSRERWQRSSLLTVSFAHEVSRSFSNHNTTGISEIKDFESETESLRPAKRKLEPREPCIPLPGAVVPQEKSVGSVVWRSVSSDPASNSSDKNLLCPVYPVTSDSSVRLKRTSNAMDKNGGGEAETLAKTEKSIVEQGRSSEDKADVNKIKVSEEMSAIGSTEEKADAFSLVGPNADATGLSENTTEQSEEAELNEVKESEEKSAFGPSKMKTLTFSPIRPNADFNERNSDSNGRNDDFTKQSNESVVPDTDFTKRNDDHNGRNADTSGRNNDFADRNADFTGQNAEHGKRPASTPKVLDINKVVPKSASSNSTITPPQPRVDGKAPSYPKSASKAELAFVKSTFVIFVSFSILMSPYMICALGDRERKWHALVHIICSYTSYVHCCVNCLVYGFMSRQFRSGYKHLMMKLKCWGSASERRQRAVAALRNPLDAPPP